MFRLLPNILLIVLIAFPVTLLMSGSAVVKAQEDVVEEDIAPDAADDGPIEDDSDSKVETEDEAVDSETETEADSAATEKTTEEEEEAEKPAGIGHLKDAETTVLFPDYPDKQLPAGKPIRVLVGLANKGENALLVETLDASFRYPQDFSYTIQNFTASLYNGVVQPGEEATYQYQFYPHESYGGRPFGVTIMMFYKDAEGTQFATGVFNETVTFQELEESFDGEQFFLYVLLAAITLLVIFGINYAFTSKSKKSASKSEAFEQGTQNGDVDYDWIPKETLNDFNKASPRRSPKQRRAQRNAGSSDAE